MEQSFLVIGAGEVGHAMLNSLFAHQKKQHTQLNISVLLPPGSANIAKVQADARFPGIKVETANLLEESIQALANVFKKYDTVICCSGFASGRGMQVKITEAVLEAGVRRYVPWQFGVDYDTIGRGSAQPGFDEQLDVRELLRTQHHTHWMIVSTGLITSFLWRKDFGIIDLPGKVIHALGDWQHALTLTSCEDIGMLTVDILFHQPAILDQVVFVAGDTLTFEEIADEADAFFNTKFERVLWDIPQLEKAVADNPGDIMASYRLVFTHPGVTWPLKGTFNDNNHIATVSLQRWMKENIPVAV